MPWHPAVRHREHIQKCTGDYWALTNNWAERSIKPFVIDRKNFLFANTPKGATGNAVMFSMIQTAIENNLDPYVYLAWLLNTAKDADLSRESVLQSLMPWNAPAECRAK